MLFECALSSFHLLILVDCITRSWNITRNNINRVFSLFLGFQHSRERTVSRHDTFSRQSHRLRNKLFLGYAIDRHEPTRTDTYSNTGAVSLSRCFDVSESDVLSSCKAAVIKSFDQSDVLQSVNVDTRQVVGDSMTTRYRIHLFVEGRTRTGHQFLNFVYFLIFMSCCTAILGTVRVVLECWREF